MAWIEACFLQFLVVSVEDVTRVVRACPRIPRMAGAGVPSRSRARSVSRPVGDEVLPLDHSGNRLDIVAWPPPKPKTPGVNHKPE